MRRGSCGFRAWPPTALQPLDERSERKLAHSLRFALPMMTRPAARSRSVTAASRSVRLSASASEPAVVGSSLVSMLSLISTGTPCSAPRIRPEARSASSAAACRTASGLTRMTALSSPSQRSMRIVALDADVF